MKKMIKNLFITGTDTGVGKTVVTAAVAGILIKKGYCPGIIKPIQTGCLSRSDLKLRKFKPDVEFLRKAVTLFSGKGRSEEHTSELQSH